ncbi:WhiB family transcriptional regulator [Micromonospora sp. NPDC005113]
MSAATLTRSAVPLDANWRLLGNCLDVDPDLMHPQDRDRYGQQEAKDVCEGCPVTAKCLSDAIKDGDWNGTRGGLTGQERRALQKAARGASINPIRQRQRPGLADHHHTIATMLDRPTPATWAQIGTALGYSGEAVKKYWLRQKLAAEQQEVAA